MTSNHAIWVASSAIDPTGTRAANRRMPGRREWSRGRLTGNSSGDHVKNRAAGQISGVRADGEHGADISVR